MNTGQPPEKKTIPLEKPPAWAIALSEKVVNGFASIENRLDTVEQNVTILVDDKKTVNERLSRIEDWKEKEVNARLNANSIRVKSESDVNQKQNSEIAQVIVKQEELVTQVATVKANQEKAAEEREATAALMREVKDDVSHFFSKHPALAAAFVTLATAAAGAITTWLSAKGHP